MTASCSTGRRKQAAAPVTFGVITDVHQDIMHDGPARLGAFVEAMNRAQVGCVVQLGDFCCPYERNRAFLETWNQATAAQRLQVLGNHDTDGGFQREQTAEFYGMPRLLAVLCGHHHQDWVHTIGGIHYVQINSASYQWVGEAHAHDSYSAEILRERPRIRMTCPYRDPLWALVTVDGKSGWLTVEGRASDWVGPSPWEVGLTRETMSPEITLPAIRNRQLRIKV